MKNAFVLGLLFLLSSCSPPPTQVAIQTDIPPTQLAQPSIPPSASQIFTNTQAPPSTSTATPSPSETPPPNFLPLIAMPPTDYPGEASLPDCIPKNTQIDQAIVVQVVDGDNIIARLADGNAYPVRYIGINSPERDRPFYPEAINTNTSLVDQIQVVLIKDVSEVDQYGRLLRYVVAGEVFVNLELVRQGVARAVSYPPDNACAQEISAAEDEARTNQRGIWAATQTPEPGAPQVVITGVNKREEWVEIQNTGSADVDLTGWTLVSERGNQDCFLSGVIKPGEILRIWSGVAQGGGFTCGYNSPIWNNSEPDPAVLYNSQGAEVSRK